mmetsp:Transcript_2885/g.5334  ORF Transcript_2885/g.5334 Transcript_2885/m.5334 type:complete len:170 (-) Transcript_2885:132-641(-)
MSDTLFFRNLSSTIMQSLVSRYSSLILLIICFLISCLVNGLSVVPRRAFLISTAAASLVPTVSSAANTRLMLNEDGEYVEIEEQDWQTAWNERLTKAKGMTPEEVFMAARGAGNTSLKRGPESDASKKRRAMAGCRDATLLNKAGMQDIKDCTARVLGGDVDFMLNVMP